MRVRTIVTVLSALLMVPVYAGSAWAMDGFQKLKPYEDGHLLARGHGNFAYNGAGDPRQKTVFKDERADGDGAYARARFQKWGQICPPRGGYCYYAWHGQVQKTTDRIGVNAGWETRYRKTDREGTKWRDRAAVCVDQSWEPDACDSSRLLYP
jgi:hypothetical protein